jgi:hypothetical membrane protein
MAALTSVVALHALRPDLAPVSRRLSEYANGPHAWLMGLAFVTAGLALLAAAAAVYTWPANRWSRAGAVLLAAAGLGMAASAVFPTDADGATTTAEQVHSAASGGATLAIVAAAITLSVVPAIRRERAAVDVVAAVLAGTGVVLAATSRVLHDTAWTGLSQRLLWLVLMAWLLRLLRWNRP